MGGSGLRSSGYFTFPSRRRAATDVEESDDETLLQARPLSARAEVDGVVRRIVAAQRQSQKVVEAPVERSRMSVIAEVFQTQPGQVHGEPEPSTVDVLEQQLRAFGGSIATTPDDAEKSMDEGTHKKGDETEAVDTVKGSGQTGSLEPPRLDFLAKNHTFEIFEQSHF